MATCKQSASELIQDTFSPSVAVFCSSDVEDICAKNNLTFVQMVQPFCRLNTELSIRDPSNVPSGIHNLRIVMKDINSEPPPLNVGKKMMHDAVTNNVLTATDGVLFNTVHSDNYQLKYNVSTPWFEAYREVFFQVLSPSEHEFIHHYLSCVFVVSSSHQDPLSQIGDLCQQQQQLQLQNSRHSSKWFFSCIFKYYLLLHDTSCENLAKAEAIYQSMKSSYGSSVCHLLQINSISKTSANSVNAHEEMNGNSHMPDPWSQFLPKYYSQQEEIAANTETGSGVPMTVTENSSNDTGNCVDVNDKSTVVHHPLLNSDELVLTDNSSEGIPNQEKTKTLTFGSMWKCFDPHKRHGVCLTPSDMDRIRVFIHDFCIQGLIPFVEKQIRILSDQVANRKSIHKTLFGMTKKIFTGNKPGVQGPAISANSVVYGPEAAELQVRKLGDLAFMFQLYEVAYQAYHTAKRDFSADQAWLHFAGASEMAALSVFMQGNNNVLHEYPARYMETAITTYLHTCKLPELFMRATFLSTECLKAKALFRDAATQFMCMPSESDLPCALFLEQAAHCFINCKPPKARKYVFHIILAGHRFGKAVQKKHALRAYRQVEQAYKSIGWNFANNHINSMIGRFSLHLSQLDSAYLAYKQLLVSRNEQPPYEQATHLKEYLLSLKQFLDQHPTSETFQLPPLPVPLIDCNSSKVLLGENCRYNEDGSFVVTGRGIQYGDSNNEQWHKLEEMVVLSCLKITAQYFNPQLYCFTQSTNNINQPLAVVNETITVEVVLTNPLNIIFTIDNVFLLWTFTTQPDVNSAKEPVSFSNELDFSKAGMLASVVETDVLQKITLESLQQRKIHLTLKPAHTGNLVIKGIAYCLLSPLAIGEENSEFVEKTTSVLSMQGKQMLELQGSRLNKTPSDRATKAYAMDNRLNLQVLNPMPKLQVTYQTFPHSLFCGEIHQTRVELKNVGEQPLHRIVLASPTPGLFALGKDGAESDLSQLYKEVPYSKRVNLAWKTMDSFSWKEEVLMPDGSPCYLQPGQSMTLPLWLRGSDTPGQQNAKLLYYYEIHPGSTNLRHRLVQHSINFDIKPSLIVYANYCDSSSLEHVPADNASSCSKVGSLFLSLEASNISEDFEEISLIQVSCISGRWHITSFVENSNKFSPVVHKGETYLINLKAECIPNEAKASSQDLVAFSCSPLGGLEIDSTAAPYSDFSGKSRYSWSDLLAIDVREKECQENLNTIILLTTVWKAKIERDGCSVVIIGQHHNEIDYSILARKPELPQIPQPEENVPTQDISPSIPVVGQLVTCSLVHPFHVQHDFNQKRILTVPVEFIAQSTCNIVLHIMIDNLSSLTRSAFGFEEHSGVMSESFTWVKGSKRELELKPGESTHLQLWACFTSSGTFNLGRLNININSGSDAIVSYIMSPYLIVISACDLAKC